ncbi:aminotransferase class I/II-fold pyridoxal phosphate-dependent enzyme [Aminipila terrae]|uniref:aminotransferase class I/II-fold pyridoxal phosphate-dependent enzyme n=1 Tax=Aminipila terrae TaxID=2697030 RepID=UPI002ED6637F
MTKYYKNTIVGYSYSKSLSLPGERIGYLVMPDELSDFENIVSAATTANRILGYVNAPSIMQRAVARCINSSVDVNVYNKNRETLYNGLIQMGYECIKPEGAFYLFVKSPIEDEAEFCEMAKEQRVLIVPGSSFACPGYVRMAYCVSYDTITGALPQMQKLMDEVKKSME